jgi:hypothetical protein
MNELEFLHVPRRRGAAFRAQAAVDAEVFVLEHEAAGLRQRFRSIERLIRIDGRRGKARAQIFFGRVARDGEAGERADIDAGVAFDALGAVKTVSISQFRQRCTSRAVCSA